MLGAINHFTIANIAYNSDYQYLFRHITQSLDK